MWATFTKKNPPVSISFTKIHQSVNTHDFVANSPKCSQTTEALPLLLSEWLSNWWGILPTCSPCLCLTLLLSYCVIILWYASWRFRSYYITASDIWVSDHIFSRSLFLFCGPAFKNLRTVLKLHYIEWKWTIWYYHAWNTHKDVDLLSYAFWLLWLSSLLPFSRQRGVPGHDVRSLLLGGHVGQSGSPAVPPHLPVYQWLLRLFVLLRSGLWSFPLLPPACRVWVSAPSYCKVAWMCGNGTAKPFTFGTQQAHQLSLLLHSNLHIHRYIHTYAYTYTHTYILNVLSFSRNNRHHILSFECKINAL